MYWHGLMKLGGDYVYWQGRVRKTLKRIDKLISDTKKTPFEGIGKPEPLKENFGFAAWMKAIAWHLRLMTSKLRLSPAGITMKNDLTTRSTVLAMLAR